MANVFEPAPDRHERFADLPPAVRAIAQAWPPWKLYRLDGGMRCAIYSYEDTDPVTVTVHVTGQYNLVLFDRAVFGIDPTTLTECELPHDDEPVGTRMTPDQARSYMRLLAADLGRAASPTEGTP